VRIDIPQSYIGVGIGTGGAGGALAPPLFVNSICAYLLLVIEAMSTFSDVIPTHILLFWYCRSMAKQLSLLSYVKTPNLARNKDSETAASESTVCEKKIKVTRTGGYRK